MFFLVCMPLVVILAAISWHVVEHPALAHKRGGRRTIRPTERLAAEPR